MKKLLLLTILTTILAGCNLNITNPKTTNINEDKNLVEQVSTKQKNDVTSYTMLNQFLGKPTIFIWGSTGCPHCLNAMPIFEKNIYNPYKGKINILLNTLSQDKFTTTLPQVQNSPFSFQSVSGESCGYIPQWIMLDAEGNIAEKSCGGAKSVNDMKLKLEELGIE